jgi:hypothetical protein
MATRCTLTLSRLQVRAISVQTGNYVTVYTFKFHIVDTVHLRHIKLRYNVI